MWDKIYNLKSKYIIKPISLNDLDKEEITDIDTKFEIEEDKKSKKMK